MYKVLNNSLEFFGERFLTKTTNILEPININIDAERKKLFSEVFEQFLLFDEFVIKTGKYNTSLHILIQELGINKTEELIENGIIKFLLWTPYIFSESGKLVSGPLIREYGSVSNLDVYDDSNILGTEPLFISDLYVKQLDLEQIIDNSLSNIIIHQDRKRIIKKIVLDKYIFPKYSDAKLAIEFVIDAYKKDNLIEFGLKNTKEPKMLGSVERQKLLSLAYDIFETTLLSNYELKYYNNYNFLATMKTSLFGLANSLKVKKDILEIYKLENIPDLKKIYLEEKINFKNVFELRQLPNAKYFRKWINEKSESVDSIEITQEYLNELSGNAAFFKRDGGKFLKTVGVFGIGVGLGAAISGINGSLIGVLLANYAKDLGISLLDAFWLDKIISGKNPRIFIDNLRDYLSNERF
ncbi:MAG TPA: hypothetical protein DEH02_01330 [Bacteroidales bacterium]|nr:MAG: hypothetical protein A2X01_15020 [Bacteroidetes bacterium GWF2_35_48]OFZ00314.1 MAG: hypothetical protein A2491_04220 [Bacteroidetes bacterium RIFOXYC12_FULL_35_7]HBX49691.1 hypothetical protein [Bacteroidales bacterium]